MNKIILIIAVIALIVGSSYFIMTGPRKSANIPQVILENLQKDKPILSQNEEEFLKQLEQNAISGGPPKDGIPAIDKPQYTTAPEADKWLLPNDVVLGVVYKDFVAVYPQRILVLHEIANDVVDGEKISITYCPLTGTAIGYKGLLASDVPSTFGVSGKLVNSNLIMYDRETDSYWPQILGKAITTPAKGRRLEEFPIVWTTWEKWKKKYPNTKVLSRETGFVRNYGENGDPYGSYLAKNGEYYTSDRLIFKPLHEDKKLSPKTVVVGIRDNKGNALAVLKDSLRKQKTIKAPLGGRTVVLVYSEDLDFYAATIKETGEWVNAFDAMWFAWVAFYPDTKLIK